jgi:ankyrin repeat protein
MMNNVMRQLTRAINRQDLDALSTILKSGADVNSRDKDGRTPLMIAVSAGNASLKVINFLIDHGADVNLLEPRREWSCVHFAAAMNRVDIVGTLIAKGAALDLQDIDGNTPLWRAVMSSQGKGDVIRLLLSHGADQNLKNKHGVSPIDLARRTANYNIRQFFE